MKLRTKLLIASTATAMTVLGISEWFGYKQAMAFLEEHAALMEHASGAYDAAEFRRDSEAFAGRVAVLHVLHAAAGAAALLLALSLFWSRLVLKPLRALLDQVTLAGVAAGSAGIIPGRQVTDEFGEVALEVGQLGSRLTSALQDARDASELSTVILLAKAAVRKTEVARDQLAGALTAIAVAERRHEAPPEMAVRSLESVLQRLTSIAREFNSLPTQHVQLEDTANTRGSHNAPHGAVVSF